MGISPCLGLVSLRMGVLIVAAWSMFVSLSFLLAIFWGAGQTSECLKNTPPATTPPATNGTIECSKSEQLFYGSVTYNVIVGLVNTIQLNLSILLALGSEKTILRPITVWFFYNPIEIIIEISLLFFLSEFAGIIALFVILNLVRLYSCTVVYFRYNEMLI